VSARSKCRRCGTKFEGRGELCLSCLANAPTLLDTDKRKAAAATKASPRVRRSEGGPVCPYCRTELSWDNMESSETEVTIYVREKMYYCPSCRALLGFSSWHTEG
jgi:hypothetical protein